LIRELFPAPFGAPYPTSHFGALCDIDALWTDTAHGLTAIRSCFSRLIKTDFYFFPNDPSFYGDKPTETKNKSEAPQKGIWSCQTIRLAMAAGPLVWLDEMLDLNSRRNSNGFFQYSQ